MPFAYGVVPCLTSANKSGFIHSNAFFRKLPATMRAWGAFVAFAMAALVGAKEPPKSLMIGVKYRPEFCPFKSQDGDQVHVYV